MHASGRRIAATMATLLASGGAALAQVPHPWQMGMQAAASPVMESIKSLNDGVLVTIIIITIFVGILLAYVLMRFSAKRNPVPSTLSHHTGLEIAWTTIPILILVAIAIPSFRLVFFQDHAKNADMTVKVVGHQWYWEYQYPDQGGLHFDSYMVAEDQLSDDQKAQHLRNLAVDNQLVVPAGKVIRILTTSADVIHSFFIPSLGVQRYAIPGHTIETWFEVNQPGDYYGECNQICGMNHSFMPISVHAVSQEDFDAWVAGAKTKFSMTGTGAQHLALNTER
jgi:cytochrome c oxidase subunit 2